MSEIELAGAASRFGARACRQVACLGHLRPDCSDVMELAEVLVRAAVWLSKEDRWEVGAGRFVVEADRHQSALLNDPQSVLKAPT
jgi:hypothetical protein